MSDSALDNAEALSNINPIPTKKTLLLVNAFIVNTVDFMNKFAALAERKIARVAAHTQRLEVMLALLEAKLESVPWLDSMQSSAAAVPAPAPPTTAAAAAAAADYGDQPPPPPGPAPAAAVAAAAAAPELVPEPPTPAADVILLKEDARYRQYMKMLAMGVPKPSVAQKMGIDGHDPAIAEMDPDGPAPPGAYRE